MYFYFHFFSFHSLSQLKLLSSLHSLDDFSEPPRMYACVFGQLRVEAATKHVALPDCNNVLSSSMLMLLIFLEVRVSQRESRHDLDLSVQLLFRKGIDWCFRWRNNGSIEIRLSLLLAVGMRQYLLYYRCSYKDASIGLILSSGRCAFQER
jgi:hypothetical protein